MIFLPSNSTMLALMQFQILSFYSQVVRIGLVGLNVIIWGFLLKGNCQGFWYNFYRWYWVWVMKVRILNSEDSDRSSRSTPNSDKGMAVLICLMCWFQFRHSIEMSLKSIQSIFLLQFRLNVQQTFLTPDFLSILTTDITFTIPMLFKPLPQNLDFFILNDHLYQALQKSKQTRHLINLRAEEIVKSVLSESLQTEIYQKYQEAIQNINQKHEECERLQKDIQKIQEKEEKKKKSLIKELKSQTQNKLIQAHTELESKDQQISELQEELSKFEEDLDQLQSENQNLASENLQKSQIIQSLNKQLEKEREKCKELQDFATKSKEQIEKILFTHQEQMEKWFTKHKNWAATIKSLQEKIKGKDQEIADLTSTANLKQNFDAEKSLKLDSELKKSNRHVQKLKKELKESEQNYGVLKKQISRFKENYKKFEGEYNQQKTLHSRQIKEKTELIQKQTKEIELFEAKTQQLKQKNDNLTKSKKKIQTKMQKLEKVISTSLLTLKQENLTLRSYVKENFLLIKEYTETSVTKIVNHLSTQLSEYFQECIFEIKKAREEKNLARQQAKIKSEIIEQLDKMLNNEAKSVYELRFELKQKIKEEQKLRKKLKNHYQETDKKLQDFHTKYISILKNEA